MKVGTVAVANLFTWCYQHAAFMRYGIDLIQEIRTKRNVSFPAELTLAGERLPFRIFIGYFFECSAETELVTPVAMIVRVASILP